MKPLRIGIVAGENSGDILGAGLIKALRHQHPELVVEGIPGPLMEQAGCRRLFAMEELAVMSITEVFLHLPRLISIRRALFKHFTANPPDIFIGIDAPEFNLTLEKKLYQKKIKTVHYNSPKIWAWRSWRVKKIAKAVNLMLTLLPFEKRFYDQHEVQAKFVGHPLADTIPLSSDTKAARQQLGLDLEQPILAVLPGSRAQEVERLAPVFLQTIARLKVSIPNLCCLVPMINARRREQFETILQQSSEPLPIKILDQHSHQVMAAADVILLASGTATLEALLFKKPMVVAYRISTISYWLVKALVRVKFISLPNLLANAPLVDEFIQDQANPEQLADAVLKQFRQPEPLVIEKFCQIHQQLKQDASRQAADAVLELVNKT